MDSGARVKQVTARTPTVGRRSANTQPPRTVPQRCPNLAHHRTSQYNSASRSPLVGVRVRSARLCLVTLTSTADSCFVGPILFLLGPISGAFPNRLWSRVPQTAPDQVLCSHQAPLATGTCQAPEPAQTPAYEWVLTPPECLPIQWECTYGTISHNPALSGLQPYVL